MSKRNAPKDKDGLVSIEPSKNDDPGEGGKIPVPDHECAGDKCWCKAY